MAIGNDSKSLLKTRRNTKGIFDFLNAFIETIEENLAKGDKVTGRFRTF